MITQAEIDAAALAIINARRTAIGLDPIDWSFRALSTPNKVNALRDAKAALEAAERARLQTMDTAPRKQHEQIIVVKSDGFCKIVEWDCDQWWDGEAGWDDDDFTHWQPLPSPPEDK